MPDQVKQSTKVVYKELTKGLSTKSGRRERERVKNEHLSEGVDNVL